MFNVRIIKFYNILNFLTYYKMNYYKLSNAYEYYFDNSKNINDTKRKLSKIASWTNTQYMIDEKPTFYVCKDFACKIPTNDIDQALKFVNE